MRATGIVRRIDDLGRVVIPKEIRKTLRIREGDPLEIFTAKDGEVILKKYSPIGELNEFSQEYAETLGETLGYGVIITDLDSIISVSKLPKKDYKEKSISKELEQLIENRETKEIKDENKIPLYKEDSNFYNEQMIMPIISTSGDCIGSIKYITVKELCELTDLNRGTFYLHYRDIYDLSEQMENEIILKFEELLNLSTAEVANNPQLVICKTFELIKQNADFCTCLLSNNGEMTFFNKLKTIIRDACFKYWTELFSRPKKVETFDYFFNFMLYGCIGLIESWLNNGLKESPKEMAQLASKVMLNGVAVLH